MTSFVRALKASEASSDESKKPRGLTVEKVIGNVFLINFAGHDTTANTLAFAIYLLASEPEVQQWLAEELDIVTYDDENRNYERLYPSLVRCRAVLVSQKPCAHQPHTHNRTALDRPLRTDFLTTSQYETLRMYPPALALPKHAFHAATTLSWRARDRHPGKCACPTKSLGTPHAPSVLG